MNELYYELKLIVVEYLYVIQTRLNFCSIV